MKNNEWERKDMTREVEQIRNKTYYLLAGIEEFINLSKSRFLHIQLIYLLSSHLLCTVDATDRTERYWKQRTKMNVSMCPSEGATWYENTSSWY